MNFLARAKGGLGAVGVGVSGAVGVTAAALVQELHIAGRTFTVTKQIAEGKCACRSPFYVLCCLVLVLSSAASYLRMCQSVTRVYVLVQRVGGFGFISQVTDSSDGRVYVVKKSVLQVTVPITFH
jgi:hypothetical protein